MKKIFIIVLCLFFFPLITNAGTFTQKDLSLNIDDNKWYVFTRDNIENNENLSKLGITYEYVSSFMTKNSVYVDACLFDSSNAKNNIDLLVLIKPVENVYNMHMYNNKDIKKLGENLISLAGASKYDIIDNNYKYVFMEYESLGNNVIDYYTVINGNGYTIKAQKINPFTTEEKNEIKTIVDNITFKIDKKYEKKETNGILYYAIRGGIIGAIVGLFSYILRSAKKKKENNINTANNVNTTSNTNIINNSVNPIGNVNVNHVNNTNTMGNYPNNNDNTQL